jgi:4-aminobutyrate aminotransferase-like enzyme
LIFKHSSVTLAAHRIKNPKSEQVLDLLRDYESRNITFMEPDGSWPIVWQRAKGVHVWDADGKKYLDLTAAFGVVAAGHANPRVVGAGQSQMSRLLHAMGDVHPHALKAELARVASRITFERWTTSAKAKTIFCNSGFEAVEAALKTALLATGKPGIIAFEGAYHGTGYGSLNATHREHFRSPFRLQLGEFGQFVPFPVEPWPVKGKSESQRSDASQKGIELDALELKLRRALSRGNVGAILVEPIQVRGGINIPPPGFLPMLRKVCDEHSVPLILDEIYTGFGRTGEWFACEHSKVIPDLICLGKALTGGFPLSACVGKADLMDRAWPPSNGEAIHTSTFLGHPVGCAMALAQIEEIKAGRLVQRSAKNGQFLLDALSNLRGARFRLCARGRGLTAGLELRETNGAPATRETLRVIKSMMHDGFILLPEGEHANVISFTPPLTISQPQLETAVARLEKTLAGHATSRAPASRTLRTAARTK